jgi:hypothetical protein
MDVIHVFMMVSPFFALTGAVTPGCDMAITVPFALGVRIVRPRLVVRVVTGTSDVKREDAVHQTINLAWSAAGVVVVRTEVAVHAVIRKPDRRLVLVVVILVVVAITFVLRVIEPLRLKFFTTHVA